jgi:hypothetical protein
MYHPERSAVEAHTTGADLVYIQHPHLSCIQTSGEAEDDPSTVLSNSAQSQCKRPGSG